MRLHKPTGEDPDHAANRADREIHVTDREHHHLGQTDYHGDRDVATQTENRDLTEESLSEKNKNDPKGEDDDEQPEAVEHP
jgi:hypothetical protein